jgi:hypothetical protein
MPAKLDESLRSQIAELLRADGIAYHEIAEQVGCSRSMVSKVAAEIGARRKRGVGFVPQRLIKALYEPPHNLGSTSIARKLSLPEMTVRRALVHMGVKLRQTGTVALMNLERTTKAVRLSRGGMSVVDITRALQKEEPRITYAIVRSKLAKVLGSLRHGNRRPEHRTDPLSDADASLRGRDREQGDGRVGDPQAFAGEESWPPAAPDQHDQRGAADVRRQHAADVHPDEA